MIKGISSNQTIVCAPLSSPNHPTGLFDPGPTTGILIKDINRSAPGGPFIIDSRPKNVAQINKTGSVNKMLPRAWKPQNRANIDNRFVLKGRCACEG